MSALWIVLASVGAMAIACVISRLKDGQWWWQYDSDLPYVTSQEELMRRLLENRLQAQHEADMRRIEWRDGH